MSRGSESIANEERFFAEAVGVVKLKGFRKVAPRKSGAAKFIDAECANGDHVSIWLKLGWATVSFGAIQFAVFAGKTGSPSAGQGLAQTQSGGRRHSFAC